MNERGHTNSVPWMYAIVPKNHLGEVNESDLPGLYKLHSFMVRSWCDRINSWYGVDAIWCAACLRFAKAICRSPTFRDNTIIWFCLDGSYLHRANSQRLKPNFPLPTWCFWTRSRILCVKVLKIQLFEKSKRTVPHKF